MEMQQDPRVSLLWTRTRMLRHRKRKKKTWRTRTKDITYRQKKSPNRVSYSHVVKTGRETANGPHDEKSEEEKKRTSKVTRESWENLVQDVPPLTTVGCPTIVRAAPSMRRRASKVEVARLLLLVVVNMTYMRKN